MLTRYACVSSLFQIEFREYPEFREGRPWGYFSDALKGKSHLYKVSTFLPPKATSGLDQGKEKSKNRQRFKDMKRSATQFGRDAFKRENRKPKSTSKATSSGAAVGKRREPEDREPRPIILGLVGEAKYRSA